MTPVRSSPRSATARCAGGSAPFAAFVMDRELGVVLQPRLDEGLGLQGTGLAAAEEPR